MLEILYLIVIYPIELIMQILLEFAFSITNSYGSAIIIMSIVINIVILPLYYLAEKYRLADRNSRDKMSSQVKYLKKHFTGKERYFYLKTLYLQHNYSPISSVKASMGLLLQIPFFFAAFHLLGNYPAFSDISFIFISNLNKADGLLWGQNLLPILMTIINLASAYFYTRNMTKADIYQLWALSAVFLVLLYFEPAALLLYWTINNLFSLIKNFINAKISFKKIKLSNSFYTGNGNFTNKVNSFYQKIKISKTVFLLLFTVAIILSYLFSMNKYGNLANVYFIIVLLVFIYLSFILILNYIATVKTKNIMFVIIVASIVVSSLTELKVFFLHDLFYIYNDIYYYLKKFLSILLLLILILGANKIINNIVVFKKIKESFAIFALTIFSLSLLIIVINPLIMYNSTDDFTITNNLLLKNLLPVFVFIVLAVIAFYKLSSAKFKKILTVISVFLLAIATLYSFVVIKDYGLMNHFIFHLANKLPQTNIEIVIELALLIILFVVINKIITYKQQYLIRFLSIFALMLIAIFILNLPQTAKTVKQQSSAKTSFDLNYEKKHTMAMSTDKNILIFMLDGFSGGTMNRIYAQDKRVLKRYEGFTWYKNTLSTGTSTWMSIAAITGGDNYTVDKINARSNGLIIQEVNNAYGVYPKYFIPDSWDITYFNPQYATNINKQVNLINQSHYSNSLAGKKILKAAIGTKEQIEISVLYALSTFKASPLLLKNKIYNNGNWLGAFNAAKQKNNTIYKAAKYWGFLRSFVKYLNNYSANKTLKYLQIGVPHKPNFITMDGKINPAKSSYYIGAYKALEKISEIIKKLKANKIYDKTKIIIFSDHGLWNKMSTDFKANFGVKVPKGIKSRMDPGMTHALLMVKDFNTKGDFKISNKFMSNKDVPAIVCSSLQNNCDMKNIDLTKDSDRNLVISTGEVKFNKDKKFKITEQYRVHDNIFDPDNWYKIK